MRTVTKWDEYNWDPNSGMAVFSTETEHPSGEVELTHVDYRMQPTSPDHAGWYAQRATRTNRKYRTAVHTDKSGHALVIGYEEGIREPIPYPGRNPMPKILYYQE